MKQDTIFHQLFEAETSTYTYLLADPTSREAILIDPVFETVERDLRLIAELDLQLLYVLDTHVHADHITGADEIRRRTGAKTGVSAKAGIDCADLALTDGQELHYGNHTLRVLETPGHTSSCLSFYGDGRVFTGDALLIRGTGRTDFQQGSSDKLYDSIHGKLFSLPSESVVYPGHDYQGHASSTIGMELKLNPRVGAGKTKNEFAQLMKELKLAQPKKINEAVPANLLCGKRSPLFSPLLINGVPEVTPNELHTYLGRVLAVDVRQPEEFNNELAHIPGSTLATLGEELTQYLLALPREQEIVFVCRTGARSARATEESLRMGFKKVANLQGGMVRWNELQLPTERHNQSGSKQNGRTV